MKATEDNRLLFNAEKLQFEPTIPENPLDEVRNAVKFKIVEIYCNPTYRDNVTIAAVDSYYDRQLSVHTTQENRHNKQLIKELLLCAWDRYREQVKADELLLKEGDII